MRISASAAVCSDIGRVRACNEDRAFLNGAALYGDGYCHVQGAMQFGEPVQLYAVCDGMGGTSYGEQAAQTAAEMLQAVLQQMRDNQKSGCLDVQTLLNDYVGRASASIRKIGDSKRAGTTLVLLCLYEGNAVIAHLGDSRAYLLRGDALRQLTQDHTEIQKLKDAGIRLDEACIRRNQNRLTRYLGALGEDMIVLPTYSETIPVQQGDTFLLTSDGVSGVLDAQTIGSILASSGASRAQDVVAAAMEAGSADNATAVVVKIQQVLSE